MIFAHQKKSSRCYFSLTHPDDYILVHIKKRSHRSSVLYSKSKPLLPERLQPLQPIHLVWLYNYLRSRLYTLILASIYLQTFLREDFWPKGVLYRRFRGRLRDTTQRNTTPMLRV
ncbi:hypothetical protein PYW08_003051 [Mythimna loreyi]|uniref:Uncharacterized protein n=1 Tax=Mythimna loreyi TaxID=667449 RepID=A0ACC2QQ39_9NEOP|nr:hypothetical protein PYW08_003051 [Mythimna loreyi]